IVPHLVTLENKRIERYIYGLALQIHKMVAAMKPTTIQSAILKVGVLTNEAIRNGSLKKNTKKIGNGREPSSDGCLKGLRMVNLLNARISKAAREACFKCGGTDHYKSACLRLNRAPRQGGNRPTQAMAIEGGQGHGNNGNQARRRAFVMGAKEGLQDPNIMTGTFTLNNRYATTLFDSGVDYSFVSTTFIPLLDIDPSNLVVKSPYHLAPSEMEELSSELRELQDNGFKGPSLSP
nr:hypothetical protein [Tanacetum cinerariifolium]